MNEPFNADDITLGNCEEMCAYRKCPVVIHAAQLHFAEGFQVTTMEGVMRGKPGDYLVIGIAGEKYPCDKEIFEASYTREPMP